MTNTNDSGPGSLRAAIELANATPGADTIAFAIPTVDPGFNGRWFTIKAQSPRPPVTDDGTTIDGSTQTAFSGDTNAAGPEVFLDGSDQLVGGGLGIQASSSVVQGLAIGNFPYFGIDIAGPGGTPLASVGNVVRGNYIGVDPTGEIAQPNGADFFVPLAGIRISGAVDTRIAGNVVSANEGNGIEIEGGATGTLVEANSIGVGLGNGGHGIVMWTFNGTPTNTTISANVVGDNLRAGIMIQGDSQRNEIVGNDILRNGAAGIELAGADNTAVQGNRVEGNGFDTSLLGCRFGCGGIVVGGFNPSGAESDRTLIGGTGAAEGNVISGNGNAGVEMRGGSGTGTTIQGNLIGTDASGSAALGNRFAGVAAQGTNTLIGGSVPGARNVISGNGSIGVVAAGNDTVVQGNYIGTKADGATALPNGQDGVLVTSKGRVMVLRNVISYNGRFGVLVRSGPTRVEANTVAGNASTGVAVNALAGTGNAITRNSIFGNGGLGIDLAPLGVNPNDPGDEDGGANDGQNYPVLERAIAAGGRLVVIGSIDTRNPESVTIEFYANAVPSPGEDPSAHGEGADFLGAATPNRMGRFTAVLPRVAAGTIISATATDAAGNTSEFAANADAT